VEVKGRRLSRPSQAVVGQDDAPAAVRAADKDAVEASFVPEQFWPESDPLGRSGCSCGPDDIVRNVLLT
jgi:hypothetical protein